MREQISPNTYVTDRPNKLMAMTMTKLMCNWTPHCDIMTCPHRTPHFPMVSKNNKPQCQQKGAYCYPKEHSVHCVIVKN